MKKSDAVKIRELIEKASVSLGDTDALAAPFLFPKWQEGHRYKQGDRVSFSGRLYRCNIDHDSESGWTPQNAPALFSEVADPSILYPDWAMPMGSHDAYGKGDRVSHQGKKWVSNTDYNVWEPGVSGWEEVL